ncbi:MAG TPA: sugar ABC transporter ATP-binding protein [Vicinamibacterales bacterium]|nr:sugar ABC transporter ATP-binding protein [Vicinamibacterales bacterium]
MTGAPAHRRLTSAPAVEFLEIGKSFGAVTALRDVTFAIERGESHAIVGENGAGKSTLLKILVGDLRPDGGALRLGGETVTLTGARDALARGVGLVHQEMLAFPNLSAAANIFAGRELTGRFGWLRGGEMRERARTLLERLDLPISPDAPVASLPIAYRQLLQVARALVSDCSTLALDEPTASLTAAETDRLFAILEGLQRRGVTLIYVSHRLPEVFRLCEQITVLRDGSCAGTFRRDAVAVDDIVQAMVGRAIPARARGSGVAPFGGPLLRVNQLTRRPCFDGVSLSIAAGEIVGLFGLVGSGRTELLETIVGLHAADGGSFEVGGAGQFRSPREAAQAGVVLVPEDRQRQGLCFNLNLRHNLALPAAEASGARLVRTSERGAAAALLARWRIKTPSADAAPGALSGGNQQKVVAAKWLAMEPRVLLLDEPTKGVDVGAKHEIHGMIREVVARGAACLIASSDLPELLGLADRIVVMREGRLQGELAASNAATFTEEMVMRLATTAPA